MFNFLKPKVIQWSFLQNMIKNCFQPLFIFMLICMMFTAATELGTTQRIEVLLGKSLNHFNIGFYKWINGFPRLYAGPIVHKLSITKVLLFSAIFSCLGLFLLANTSGAMTFLAAAVFAIGVCYFGQLCFLCL